jgi:hypothetical protein
MAPCAVQFDAQKGASLTWAEVRDSEFLWDFDDGGSRTDSEGFLAAAVYERAGTYYPSVTVDGETWNVQTITVLDPTRTVCVGTDFSDCPSTAAGDHFATLSSAVSGTNSEARRHILLERGGSFGTLPSTGSVPTMIGAYSSGAKPIVTASGFKLVGTTAIVDLAVTGSGGGNAFDTSSSVGGLLLRMTGTGSVSNNWIYTGGSAFIIDSSIITNAPYPVFAGDNTHVLVIKGSTISRNSSGEHTMRIDGAAQERILLQNSSFLCNGLFKDDLTIRGTTSWMLVQGNHFDGHTGNEQSEPGDPRWQQRIVFERNSLDRSSLGASTDWGFQFGGKDIIVRNNIVYGGGGQFDYRAVSLAVSPDNIQFINNTAHAPRDDGFRCAGSGCVMRNNLVYSPSSVSACYTGTATSSNNWCRTSNICLDPVTGGSTCYDPNFESTNPTSPDFLRPGAGARGIDAADPNVPVWDDYDNADRTTIDVGAVEG